MLFNSPEFLIFLAIVYTAYRLLNFRGQNAMLLVTSYIFYGWWDSRFLFLMAFSTVVDFWVGLTMEYGVLTRREKITSGLFLFLATVVFLGLSPAGVLPGDGQLIDPAKLIKPDWLEWGAVGVLAYLALMYAGYRFVIRQSEQRRRFLCLLTSVVTQITLLGTFKYFNFFADSAAALLADFGIEASYAHLNVILPV
ncbi:MAG: hypothetical protein ABUL53_05900, partial [Bradyrhizobium guangdongense]